MKLKASFRSIASLTTLTLFLGACSEEASGPEIKGTLINDVEGFAGVIAADEPRAAQIGREVLGRGGTAADAATAMYFAMTVSLPSRVGLGAGGVCLIHDQERGESKMLSFPIIRSEQGGSIPTSLRAIAAMQARYGISRWAELVSYGERLAHFGNPVSRSFSYDLALAEKRLRVNKRLLSRFAGKDGHLPREGNLINQFELASVLSGIRTQGAGYFYDGQLTNRYAHAATAAGMPIDPVDLRSYIPVFVDPVKVEVDGESVIVSGQAGQSGVVAGTGYALMVGYFDLEAADQDEKAVAIAEALKRAWSARGEALANGKNSLTEEGLESLAAGFNAEKASIFTRVSNARAVAGNPFSAGFSVIDRFNSAVACSFSLNGLFGAQRVAGETGVIMGKPDAENKVPVSDNLTAMLIVNEARGEVRFAGSASGGAVGASALAQVAALSKGGTVPLRDAGSNPRIHHSGQPDVAFVEQKGKEVLSILGSAGFTVRQAPEFGRVNAALCVRSADRSSNSCTAYADERGYGLAQRVQ